MNIVKIGLILLFCFLVSSVSAESMNSGSNINGLKIKPSDYSVAETLDRFEMIIKKKGITVFARIDHAQGAQKAGLSLAPTQVIIFGNPKLGTPLMNSQQTAAIDLPLKAIAWQDEQGKVWLAYNLPEYIANRHGIKDQDAVVKKMTGAVNKFSDFATKKSQ